MLPMRGSQRWSCTNRSLWPRSPSNTPVATFEQGDDSGAEARLPSGEAGSRGGGPQETIASSGTRHTRSEYLLKPSPGPALRNRRAALVRPRPGPLHVGHAAARQQLAHPGAASWNTPNVMTSGAPLRYALTCREHCLGAGSQAPRYSSESRERTRGAVDGISRSDPLLTE